MSPSELANIHLVSDIPGSERWPIRALFQRDVDTDRVTSGLIPYLRDSSQVRFFNPLTLTLLPMDRHGHTVLSEMPAIRRETCHLDHQDWQTLERLDFYRFRWIDNPAQYGALDWNSNRSRLVAIDGQHRLFGLKRLWDDSASGGDFLQWRIPVVVVSFRSEEQRQATPTVLDTVRSIFVSINTNAQEVNDARRILLSDDSVNALCTQELIEAAHSNDKRIKSVRKRNRLPLLFFDWRGEEKNKRAVRSTAALKTTAEIRDWFQNYLLGSDLEVDQRKAMEIVPTSPLYSAFVRKRLTHEHAELVRQWARERLLPGLEHVLENFTPFAKYIETLRLIEERIQYPTHPDVVRHAFDQLRFGSNRAHGKLQEHVNDALKEIMTAIETAKTQNLDRIISEDIGLRGVVWAFGHLRNRFAGPPDWLEYAQRFTASLNRVYDDGWLTAKSRRGKRGFLLHVVEDQAGTIVNYRLESAKNALGTHLALLVAAYGMPWPPAWKFSWTAFMEDRLGTWQWTIERGYRKQFKGELQEQYPEGGTPLIQAANQKAHRRARHQTGRFRTVLAQIVESKLGGGSE